MSIGWWATLICATLVLVVWRGHDALEISRHDAMTGLLTRAGFDVRLTDAIEAGQNRGQYAALLAIDLDGFRASTIGTATRPETTSAGPWVPGCGSTSG